jgi:hypothetical protein
VVLNKLVVRTVSIGKHLYVLEDILTICNFLARAYPQFLFWILEALSFDVFYLIDCIVFLFPPFEPLVEKVQHCEVERPNVVSP